MNLPPLLNLFHILLGVTLACLIMWVFFFTKAIVLYIYEVQKERRDELGPDR